MSKEKPILFKAEMVRAILSGDKTMTRRVIKGVPRGDHFGKDIMDWALSSCYTDDEGRHHLKVQSDVDDNNHTELFCPQGKPGDLLWVRETWQRVYRYDDSYCIYGADYTEEEYINLQPWKPSIHQFRDDSRILLKITNVRVERLQDISEGDATREGIEKVGSFIPEWKDYGNDSLSFVFAVDSFRTLWDSINGKPRKDGVDISWRANPFVWVIEFEKLETVNNETR